MKPSVPTDPPAIAARMNMRQTLALLLLIGVLASFWQCPRSHGDAVPQAGSSQEGSTAGETREASLR